MAALVVRSSDEKSLLSGLGHSIFQPDKAGGGRGGGGVGSGGGGGSRPRKSKNGPKKQPQRGLGVAQLEKLRIQEETKQDAACLASFGLVPLPAAGFGFVPEQLLARNLKGGGFQIGASSSILGSGAFLQGSSDPGALKHLINLHQQQQQQQDKNAAVLMAAMRASRSEAAEMIKQEMKQQQQPQHRGGENPAFGGVNCVQLFDSSLPPGPLPIQRDCREPSMIGVPKELSSFQTKFQGLNQVWQPLHNASPVPKQRLVVQENPRVFTSEVHSQQTSETTDDTSLKSTTTAHYTPRTISNALCTTFLKAEVPSKQQQQQQSDPPTATDGFGRKRGSPYSDINTTTTTTTTPSHKKPAISAAAAASDFLALSLSIFHPDNAPAKPQTSASIDSSSLLQRSLSSLQETSCSGLSSDGYGNGGGACFAGGVSRSSSRSSSGNSCSSSSSSSQVVDLSLKLAI